MSDSLKQSVIRWILCGLLAVAAFVTYLPTLGYPYINLDDPDYIINNLHVRQGMTVETVRWAFTSVDNSNWHPLTSLSNMAVSDAFGLEPAWQHGLNILFHSLNTVLVFLLMQKLGAGRWVAVFVALLFAWHPMHVESVAWISERKDVLSGFFFFLTLLAYVRYVELLRAVDRRRGWVYAATLLFFALGLMSKPMLVTLPCVMLLLDLWPLGRIQFPGIKLQVLWRLVLEKIPFFLLTAGSCWVTVLAQNQALISTSDFSLEARLAHVPVAYVWYVIKCFWPVGHSVYCILHGADGFDRVAGALLVMVSITLFCLRFGRRYPYLLMGWLWFLVTLIPVVGFVQAGSQAYADRYTYLPYLGLFIMVAFGALDLCRRFRFPLVPVGFLAAVALTSGLWLTHRQVAVWESSEKLFKQAVDQDPENQEAWILYGLQFNHAGNPDKAIECMRQAIALNYGNVEAWNDLGRILTQKGSYDEAQNAFETALLGGRHLTPSIYKNLADMYLKMGKTPEAITNLEKSLDYKPDQPGVLLSLALTYASADRSADAIAGYEHLIRLIGDNADAQMGLADVYGQSGQRALAVEHYRRAIALKPDLVAALNNLAWLLATSPEAEIRNGPEAVRLAEKACELSSYREAFLMGTLAAAYAEAGQFTNAVSSARRAIATASARGYVNVVTNNERLLKIYESGRAYHEPVASP